MQEHGTNVFPTEKQLERLPVRVQHEGVSIAERIRWAVDTYLTWDDPASVPTPPKPPTRKSHSSPVSKTRGFLARVL
ncbi:MAG: CopG family transcriptional regulator [Ktedonobacteraceae bacterium]